MFVVISFTRLVADVAISATALVMSLGNITLLCSIMRCVTFINRLRLTALVTVTGRVRVINLTVEMALAAVTAKVLKKVRACITLAMELVSVATAWLIIFASVVMLVEMAKADLVMNLVRVLSVVTVAAREIITIRCTCTVVLSTSNLVMLTTVIPRITEVVADIETVKL